MVACRAMPEEAQPPSLVVPVAEFLSCRERPDKCGEHIYVRRASAQLGRPCTAQQERSDWWGQLTSQVRKPSLRQIVGANENRPIHFGVAGKIFPPHLLLTGLAVR